MVGLSYKAPDQQTVAQQVNTPDASQTNTAIVPRPNEKIAANPAVDQLVAANVAATIAERADLPIAPNVANLSQSLNAESALSQTDVNVINKPQIIQPMASNRAIQQYTAKAGDTIPGIADNFKISAQSIKWSNNLDSDAVESGKVLNIPPVEGILYTVKDGDSVDTIADKYKSDKTQIISYNDLELGGLATGRQIVLPGGSLPENERPGYVAPSTRNQSSTTGTAVAGSTGVGVSRTLASISAGNRYAFGNCTSYAYERRVQLGLPVGSFWGNAATWASYASAAGLRVDGSPAPGSIMQNSGGYGGYGHVAIVESVNPGVSVTISEMNGFRWGGGFNRIATGQIPWSEATGGGFRYIH